MLRVQASERLQGGGSNRGSVRGPVKAGAFDAQNVISVPVPLSIYVLYKLRIRDKFATAAEALKDYQALHSNDARDDFGAQTNQSLSIDEQAAKLSHQQLFALRCAAAHSPAAAQTAALHVAPTGDSSEYLGSITSESALERLEFVLDRSRLKLSSRQRIVLPNLLVLVLLFAVTASLSLGMRNTFLSNREANVVEGLRTTVATFGTAFASEFINKALFELLDEAVTVANWVAFLWAMSQRETKISLEVIAESASVGLETLAAEWSASRAAVPAEALDNIRLAVVALGANASLPRVDSVSNVAAMMGLLTLRCPWLHTAVIQMPSLGDVRSLATTATTATTTVSFWSGNSDAPAVLQGARLTDAPLAFFNATCVDNVLTLYQTQALAPTQAFAKGEPISAFTSRATEDTAAQVPSNTTNSTAANYSVGRATRFAVVYGECWTLLMPSIGAAVVIRAHRLTDAADMETRLAAAANEVGDTLRAEAQPSDFGARVDDISEHFLVALDVSTNVSLPRSSWRLVSRPYSSTAWSSTNNQQLSDAFVTWLGQSTQLTNATLLAAVRNGTLDALLASVTAPRLPVFVASPNATSALPSDGIVGPSFVVDVELEPLNNSRIYTWAPLPNVSRLIAACFSPAPSLQRLCAVNETRTHYFWVSSIPRAALRQNFVGGLIKSVETVNSDAAIAHDVFLVGLKPVARGARPSMQYLTRSKSVSDDPTEVVCATTSPLPPNTTNGTCESLPQTLSLVRSGFATIALDNLAAYETDDVVFARVNGSGSSLVTDRRGLYAVGAWAAIPVLGVVFGLTDSVEGTRSRARDALVQGIRDGNAATAAKAVDDVTTAPTVELVQLADAPASPAFDPTAQCTPPVWCLYAHRWNASSQSWVAQGVTSRSDCVGCVPANTTGLGTLWTATGSLSELHESIVDELLLDLQPWNPDVSQSRHSLDDTDADTVVPDGSRSVVSFVALPSIASVVTVVLDVGRTVDRRTLTDFGVLVGYTAFIAFLGCVFLWLVGARVEHLVVREYRRTKQLQSNEQAKLRHLLRHRIPVAMDAKLSEAGRLISSEHADVAVGVIDHVRFSEATASWTPRDVLRYITYWRHMVNKVAAHTKVSVVTVSGDVIHFVAGLAAGGSSLSASATDALRMCMMVVQFATINWTHRPWLVEELTALFQFTAKEKAERDRQSHDGSFIAKLTMHNSMNAQQLKAAREKNDPDDRRELAPMPVRHAHSSAGSQMRESNSGGSNLSDTTKHTGTSRAEGHPSSALDRGVINRDFSQGVPDAQNRFAMVPFRMVPVRAGVHVGQSILVVSRLPASPPSFDCFSNVIAVANRLQATALPCRVHVTSQLKDIVSSSDEHEHFKFSQPLRTVMKGGQNITSFLVTMATVPIPDDLLTAIGAIRSDRSFKYKGDDRAKQDSSDARTSTGGEGSKKGDGRLRHGEEEDDAVGEDARGRALDFFDTSDDEEEEEDTTHDEPGSSDRSPAARDAPMARFHLSS